MRCAVLIIGSLLWETHKLRREWRQKRLDLSKLEIVTAPIRYARRSSSRGNTFTMTFDITSADGRAVAVPCREQVCSIDDLAREAQHLWHAEQPSARFGPICADWGCVGVLFRTGDVPLRSPWNDFFAQKAKAISPTKKTGQLAIPWPKRILDGKPYEADILLATATLAATNIPSPQQVADAWVDQGGAHESYFFHNVKHGIRTEDDVHIWERVKERKPVWLKPGTYDDAVTTLELELAQRRPRR